MAAPWRLFPVPRALPVPSANDHGVLKLFLYRSPMNEKFAGLREKTFKLFVDVLARPIQTALRRFPWPVKRRILKAPPLPATHGDCSVIVMTTKRDWLDALWSAYSWQYFAKALSSPTIVVDDEVTEEMRRQAHRILPGVTVMPAEAYLEASEAALPRGRRFFRSDRFGRKLALVLVSSNLRAVVFSDSDILLFKEPTEILSHITMHPDTALYNVGGGGTFWNAPEIMRLMSRENISPMPGFNSGLMYVPKSGLDMELCARCLEAQEEGKEHFFTEQSIFNALLSSAGARPLNPTAYAVSDKGMYFYQRDVDYADLTARHFTGVVRHKMYTAGMPLLARKFHC